MAARGLDFMEVDHVIHFQVPLNTEVRFEEGRSLCGSLPLSLKWEKDGRIKCGGGGIMCGGRGCGG